MKLSFNIILYQPEIPPNTGNIIRLCFNTNSKLHLIKPLGFDMNNKSLIRAGLDYHDEVYINEYSSLETCMKKIGKTNLYLITKFGKRKYSSVKYEFGDSLLFGSETLGLPNQLLERTPENLKLYIPMTHKNRSINLSNAVSICVYEAWKQKQFKF